MSTLRDRIDEHRVHQRHLLFLRALSEARNGCRVLRPNLDAEALLDLDHMVRKGWITTGNALVGPLGIKTGEKCATITRAGREYLALVSTESTP